MAGSKESTQSTAVTATIFPQPPTGLTAEAGTNSVKLTWTASSDTAVIGYWISQTVDSTTTGIDVEGRSTATYTVTGLTAGKEYSFTITKRVNAGGGPGDIVISAPSTAVTVTPKPAITIDTNIATPEEVVAFPDAGKISLSWKVSSDTNVTGYKIYQDGTLIHTVPYRIPTIPHRMRPPTRVEYDVTGLTNGKEYSFTVSAVVGSSESAQSTAVTATPTTTPAPTGLSATAGMEQVVLNWTLSSDTSVTGYKIYQDSNKTGIAVSGRETITHTVTGLTAGTEYSFTITAIAGSSESAQSAPVKATPR